MSNTYKNLDGSAVDSAAVEWQAGRPAATDFTDCAQIRNKKLQDGICGTEQQYVCKIGASACAPTGWSSKLV